MSSGPGKSDPAPLPLLSPTPMEAPLALAVEIDGSKEESAPILLPIMNEAAVDPRQRLINKSSKIINNELLMSKIANDLPAWCLQDLRSTCPIWNLSFIPPLKKIQPTIFLNRKTPNTSTVSDFLELMRSSSDPPFKSFHFDFDQVQELPDSDRDRNLDRESFLEFISEFGSVITNLQMNWTRESDLSVSQLKNLIFNQLPNLTVLHLELARGSTAGTRSEEANIKVVEVLEGNSDEKIPKLLLRRLQVGVCTGAKLIDLLGPDALDEEDDQTQNRIANPVPFIQLISKVIQCSHDLGSIHLIDDSFESDFLKPIIRGLRNSAINICNLKSLHISFIERQILKHLIKLAQREAPSQLRLSSFDIRAFITADAFDEEAELIEVANRLHKFLTTQAPTLTSLTICFVGSPFDDLKIPLQIPRLPELTTFAVFRTTFRDDEIQFDGESEPVDDSDPESYEEDEDENYQHNFIENFPSLTKFSYKYDLNSYPLLRKVINESFHGRIFHAGVTALELNTGLIDYYGFANFSSVFPGITRLKLILQDRPDQMEHNFLIDVRDFACLWTGWPLLTDLHVQIQFGARDILNFDLDLDALLSGVPRLGLERLRLKFDPMTVTLDSLHALLADSGYKIRAGVSDLKNLRKLHISTTATGEGCTDPRPQLTDIGAYFGIAIASPTLQEVFINGHGKNLLTPQCSDFIRSVLGPLTDISL